MTHSSSRDICFAYYPERDAVPIHDIALRVGFAPRDDPYSHDDAWNSVKEAPSALYAGRLQLHEYQAREA